MNTLPQIHTLLEDENGGYSSRRLIQLLWFAALIGCIVFLVVVKRDFPALPDAYVWLSAAMLGGGVLSKAIERKPVADMVKDILPPTTPPA